MENNVRDIKNVCSRARAKVRTKIGKHLCHIEHFVYGVTYLLIGYTELRALYYAFAGFVFVTIVFGEEK